MVPATSLRFCLCLVCLTPLLLAVPAAAARPVELGFLFSDGQMPGTVAAYRELLLEHPELRDRVRLHFLTESTFDDLESQKIADSDVLVLDIMNQQMLDRFNETHDLDLLARVEGRGHVIAVGQGLLPKEHYLDQGVLWDETAHAYWAHSGPSNQLGLIKLALDLAGIPGLELPSPVPSLDFGYYYPTAQGGRVFAGWQEFDDWRRQAGKRRTGAARVAVGFYRAAYYGGETEVIDAVIGELERRGAEAIPLFGYPGHVAFERLLLDRDGRPRADVGLAFLFRFAQPESALGLAKIDIPILNLATLYGRSEEQWRASRTGLSVFEGTFQVAAPEFAGLLAPTVVGSRERIDDPGSGLAVVRNRPIAERIGVAVDRALRYARLRQLANGDKRVALLYYNYPPGRANIGASYLNVAESLANVLARLAREGYDLGGPTPGKDRLLEAMTAEGRNVAGYAPGELEEMLAAGSAERIDIATYRRWLDRLAPGLRRRIVDDWGEPEATELMATDGGGDGRSLVVPVLRYGKVALLPQPARGWGEDRDKLYHAQDLAPHHQYVATYLWLRHGFAADAIVHVGTHGTLEWLDGKDAGLAPDDAPEALIADLPNLYIYNVDVVGEGLVARRRSAAALVDHMVPPFRRGGLYPELAELGERINDHGLNLHKNPELAERYADEIRERVIELGIAKDLGLDLVDPGSLDHDTVHEIQDHLVELKNENIPYGLHAFGRVPEKAHRDSTVAAIVSVDRSLLPEQATVLAADMEARIVASGARELDHLMHGLAGGYLPGGNGGEPIRNPDSYPTGKNFYGIDPDKVPKKAAYRLGVELAEQMLAEHLAEHGRYPSKVSFVIWGDETLRHEGVLESQIFHLLGTRPIWNERDKVVDVEVIPARELGRPRIDVVIASAAEGMFYNVTMLIDKAVQKVKVLDEAENLVRRHYLASRRALIERGYSEEEADRRAAVRIFDEPPGVYNLNTSRIVEASGSWESDLGIANDYMKKMGHGYGNGFWGEPMEEVFRLALAGTEKVVHSSSTMLYGILDNDDFYMYMGGLATAVRSLDGRSPELVVTNTRDPSRPEMTPIDKLLGTELRSRYLNPTWIEGMKREGYAGAVEMRAFVEYLWGWDVTATETVDDAMWREAFGVYVEDRHGLGMEEFFDSDSPFALQDIAARMLETIRKEYWQADATTLTTLLERYLGSIDKHGIGCSEHTCGNPQLLDFVRREARERALPETLIDRFERAVERVIGAGIAESAVAAAELARTNDARVAERQAAAASGRASLQVRGYRMERVGSAEEATSSPVAAGGVSRPLAELVLAAGLIALLLVWRQRRAAVLSRNR